MASDDKARFFDRLTQSVRRHFLWLLVACYALAALWPAPGLAMRLWEWSSVEFGRVPLSLPLLLLAVMLYAAATLTDLSQIRLVSRHPIALGAALVAVWLAPALLVVAAGYLIPSSIGGHATAGLLVGAALVATMPVANSSVGWTQTARGNLGLALALVVLSITLSPWITPGLLSLLGMSLEPSEQALCEALVSQFSGVFFIIWVIFPTTAGLVSRHLLGPERVDRIESYLVLASAGALLLLNYINSALALPRIREAPAALLAATAVLAVATSAVGMGSGSAIGWALRLKAPTRSALVFGLGMKHTGLALLLAGAVLADQPLAILVIVLATLMQHLLAAIVQWWKCAWSSDVPSDSPGA